MIAKAFRIILPMPMLWLVFLTHCDKPAEADLVFIAAADWRYTATEEYHSPEYFLGALNAIAEVGKGSFMISPGDVEPLSASEELIAQVLGADYPWYPVIGNHELESPDYLDYLRSVNAGGTTLPNIVRAGPPGSLETTYSFDWGACHFVVLNQYFDGESDTGTDGDVVPELLDWLERDLSENTKGLIFVFGHEPLIAIPDMHNGRLRHQGDSLDKYMKNWHRFHQLLLKHDVTVYICGHTHNTSVAKINGLWQIDVGHARGTEDLFPALLYSRLVEAVETGQRLGKREDEIIAEFFRPRMYGVKKTLYYSELTNGISYKQLADQPGLEALMTFYSTIQQDPEVLDQYCQRYWDNWNLTRSTFVRMRIKREQVTAEIYRNNARGGPYTLTHTQIIN
ncbi:MAG: metallophosphoesterase [Fidelibacterota bacterium]|nr:MAG: metallophosphoesterase [Candidatus Neomarinimicrobiota bacterium]